MKKLLIIGTGGVGSYLARALYEYDKRNQLPNLQITLADGDDVDVKNLTYQNFDNEDILENKAQALGKKYKFIYIPRMLNPETDLNGYDAIVCAVDSTKFRKKFFKFVNESSSIYWVDLRAVGKTVAAYSKHPKLSYEQLLDTLPINDIENSSCQLSFELNNNIVQGGNKIIAEIGAQLVLSWYRGQEKENPKTFSFNF